MLCGVLYCILRACLETVPCQQLRPHPGHHHPTDTSLAHRPRACMSGASSFFRAVPAWQTSWNRHHLSTQVPRSLQWKSQGTYPFDFDANNCPPERALWQSNMSVFSASSSKHCDSHITLAESERWKVLTFSFCFFNYEQDWVTSLVFINPFVFLLCKPALCFSSLLLLSCLLHSKQPVLYYLLCK